MKICHIIAMSFAMSLAMTGSAQAEPERVLKPSGPWAMEYADQTCRLIRNFTDGSSEVTLSFERTYQSPNLTLGLAGDTLKGNPIGYWIGFRYNGDKMTRDSALLRSVLRDGRESFLITYASLLSREQLRKLAAATKPPQRLDAMTEAETAVARQINSVTIMKGVGKETQFLLGPMSAPLKAIQTCVDDLVRSWGVDPRQMATLSRGPEPIAQRSWINYSDYPDEMWRKSKTGIIPMRLVIDEAGTVQSCLVDVDQRGAFENAVCNAVMKRARFKPALNAEKKPVRSYWVSWVGFAP